jgi:hypothetical protein
MRLREIFQPQDTYFVLTEAEARIQHAEDLVFWEGSKGAMRALNALKSLEGKGHKNVSLKFDGSPAIIFGRNEDGEFILTDKSGFGAKRYDGKAKSGEELEDMLLSRSGGKNRDNPDYQAFAARMKSIFDEYERAVPEDFRGYFKGDLLYFSTPPVKNNNYVFKPNVVEYAVDVDSDLGKRIGQSKTGVVVHRQMDLEGNESEVQDKDIFQGKEVLVVPSVYTEQPAEVSGEETEKLESIIKKNAQGLDELLNQDTLAENKMKDFPNILYAYTNSKVDTGLEDLGKDFVQWLERQPRISERKKENVKNYIQQHDAAFEALWRIVNAVMQVKNSIIDQFDAQSKSVKQSMASEKGGEGYVLAHPEGDIKLVPRQTFSRINRAAER